MLAGYFVVYGDYLLFIAWLLFRFVVGYLFCYLLLYFVCWLL